MHTILVVDDDPMSCQALARLLSRLGDRALCVTGGRQALESLEHHIPRLIILDIMMPEMDGFAVLDAVRADPRLADVPVVMFSAMADPKTIQKARDRGATDYWVKTLIDYAHLRELVEPYVGGVA